MWEDEGLYYLLLWRLYKHEGVHRRVFQNSSSVNVLRSPRFLSTCTCNGLYLKTTSPFSSPPNSHGSTSTASPSRTQSVLLTFPGMRQSLSFPSMHFTLSLDPPSRCSMIPMICPSRGSFVLLISSCCSSSVIGGLGPRWNSAMG